MDHKKKIKIIEIIGITTIVIAMILVVLWGLYLTKDFRQSETVGYSTSLGIIHE
jgi:hypothetical protein